MSDMRQYRVGLGTDVHRLQVGRTLKLAGVALPGVMGPDAHSDGDVVLHALCDALTGAAGLPDIGELFPNTDPAYKAADSSDLLRSVLRRVRELDWQVVNADVVVHLQHVKLSPHKTAMRAHLAELLGVTIDQVNVKGKTAERMGPVGEGRAVEAIAIVLLGKARGGLAES